jgi:hypothetical protein
MNLMLAPQFGMNTRGAVSSAALGVNGFDDF